MRWLASLLTALAVAGCGVTPQPESRRTVAAFEIALPTKQDRTAFLEVFRTAALQDGLHVDAASDEELDRDAAAIPAAKMTINAAAYRGPNDDRPEADVMDQPDHQGRPWITFLRGDNPALATRFRDRVMATIRQRWPETLSLPIMPTGAIPLASDLIRTPEGYILNPAAASKYRPTP